MCVKGLRGPSGAFIEESSTFLLSKERRLVLGVVGKGKKHMKLEGLVRLVTLGANVL
jgi:hypothetical protein